MKLQEIEARITEIGAKIASNGEELMTAVNSHNMIRGRELITEVEKLCEAYNEAYNQWKSATSALEGKAP